MIFNSSVKNENLMKRTVWLVLLSVMILTSIIEPVAAASLYKDVEQTDWFYDSVKLLSKYNIINGYSDGTYNPDGAMSVAEFIKTIVMAARHYDVEGSSSGYWAQSYIDRAMEYGYIEEGQFDDYNQLITRGQMSRIIANALPDIGLESFDDETCWERYEMRFSDYDQIQENQQDAILMVYSKGILGGYPDGEFKADQQLTRSEASVILCRLMVKTTRLDVVRVTDDVWESYK